MGIDYTASTGYGFVLYPEDLKDLAEKHEYVPDGCDSLEEAFDIGYDYEFAEWFSEYIGLPFTLAGSAYGKHETEFLFGLGFSTSRFGFKEIDLECPDLDTNFVDCIADAFGFDPRWYLGLYVW